MHPDIERFNAELQGEDRAVCQALADAIDEGLSEALGLPETVIGLIVVAVGTSPPELATTLAAARRGQTDVAIGNIVGSNIHDLLFIWGLSITILPSALPAGGAVDLLVMTGFALLLVPLVFARKRLDWLEGAPDAPGLRRIPGLARDATRARLPGRALPPDSGSPAGRSWSAPGALGKPGCGGASAGLSFGSPPARSVPGAVRHTLSLSPDDHDAEGRGVTPERPEG